MILDQQLLFADKQVVTATAAATNDIDLGPFTGGTGVNPFRDIGAGEPIWLFCAIGATDIAPGAATISVVLSTDADPAFGTPVVLGPALAIPAGAKAGQLFAARLNPANYERYLRATWTVTGGPLTTGTPTLGIIWDANVWRAYASGFTTGVTAAQGP